MRESITTARPTTARCQIICDYSKYSTYSNRIHLMYRTRAFYKHINDKHTCHYTWTIDVSSMIPHQGRLITGIRGCRSINGSTHLTSTLHYMMKVFKLCAFIKKYKKYHQNIQLYTLIQHSYKTSDNKEILGTRRNLKNNWWHKFVYKRARAVIHISSPLTPFQRVGDCRT